MKISRISLPFPAIQIDDFIPSESIVRAASESFNDIDDWVKYNGGDHNQVQFCSKLGRENVPSPALALLDYIAIHFDPNIVFNAITDNSFPDMSHYGGGVMVTPSSNGEGGYLGMHVDADIHGIQKNWKREYSVILGLSEEYDSSFDLLLHDGKSSHVRIPYKFNSLWAFKCLENSWHGVDKITNGFDRKALGVMYWSVMSDEDKLVARAKPKFNNSLVFK